MVFLGATLPNFEDWSEVIYYNTGLGFTPQELWAVAEHCNNLERLFNLREDLQRNDPAKGSIQIVKWENEGRYSPMICQQCEDAPCKNVCPVGAISRDKDVGFLKVNHEVCIGCRSCVGICPFGAMNFNPTTRRVFKCDLCGGNPQCVRFYAVKTVDSASSGVVRAQKKGPAPPVNRMRIVSRWVLVNFQNDRFY